MSLERKWAYRIEHILDAIAKIQRYTANLSEAEFAQNELIIDAVIRNFQVIGEAARGVPNEAQSRFSDIPWTQMMGMRNIIVHGYDVIRLDIVWRTIQNDLPPLLGPLTMVLQSARREDDVSGQADQGNSLDPPS